MKSIITLEEWRQVEEILMKCCIGYNVKFDNHNGTAEMLINLDTIGIYRGNKKSQEEVSI